MGDRHAKLRDTGVKVVHEVGNGAGQFGLVLLDQTFGQLAGDGARRRLIGGAGADLVLTEIVAGKLLIVCPQPLAMILALTEGSTLRSPILKARDDALREP